MLRELGECLIGNLQAYEIPVNEAFLQKKLKGQHKTK